MNKLLGIGIIIGIAVLVTMSCAGTPAPVEESPAAGESPAEPALPPAPAVDPDTEPPDQAALDRLQDAKNRLLEAREAAVTAEGSRYFPGDWEAAEAGSPAGEPETGTLGDLKAALEVYNAAAADYEALAEKSRPLYAADMEAALNKARAGAVEAGAPDQLPDPFLAADGAFEEAAAHYEAGEYEAAVSSARLALGIYGILESSVKSLRIQQEIEDRDFVKYDPVNFDFAGELYDAAWADYDAGSMEDAREKAEQALVWYGQVLDGGWESFASEWGTAAAARQQEALDLKANMAAREEYEEAVEVLKKGDGAFYERKFDEAVSLYTLADAQFQKSANTAQEKRLLAQDAIQEAQERVSRSADTARDAELLMGGGSQ